MAYIPVVNSQNQPGIAPIEPIEPVGGQRAQAQQQYGVADLQAQLWPILLNNFNMQPRREIKGGVGTKLVGYLFNLLGSTWGNDDLGVDILGESLPYDNRSIALASALLQASGLQEQRDMQVELAKMQNEMQLMYLKSEEKRQQELLKVQQKMQDQQLSSQFKLQTTQNAHELEKLGLSGQQATSLAKLQAAVTLGVEHDRNLLKDREISALLESGKLDNATRRYIADNQLDGTLYEIANRREMSTEGIQAQLKMNELDNTTQQAIADLTNQARIQTTQLETAAARDTTKMQTESAERINTEQVQSAEKLSAARNELAKSELQSSNMRTIVEAMATKYGVDQQVLMNMAQSQLQEQAAKQQQEHELKAIEAKGDQTVRAIETEQAGMLQSQLLKEQMSGGVTDEQLGVAATLESKVAELADADANRFVTGPTSVFSNLDAYAGAATGQPTKLDANLTEDIFNDVKTVLQLGLDKFDGDVEQARAYAEEYFEKEARNAHNWVSEAANLVKSPVGVDALEGKKATNETLGKLRTSISGMRNAYSRAIEQSAKEVSVEHRLRQNLTQAYSMLEPSYKPYPGSFLYSSTRPYRGEPFNLEMADSLYQRKASAIQSRGEDPSSQIDKKQYLLEIGQQLTQHQPEFNKARRQIGDSLRDGSAKSLVKATDSLADVLRKLPQDLMSPTMVEAANESLDLAEELSALRGDRGQANLGPVQSR